MRTSLELYLCAMDDETVLYHRCLWDISGCAEDPDRVVQTRLAELWPEFSLYCRQHGEQGLCAHSTSWRYHEAGIVLTYLLLLPLEALAGLPLACLRPQEVAPVTAAAPLCPRPRAVAEEQVLAHGLGHLRYLVEERGEPFVSAAVHNRGALPVLGMFPPTVAGRLSPCRP